MRFSGRFHRGVAWCLALLVWTATAPAPAQAAPSDYEHASEAVAAGHLQLAETLLIRQLKRHPADVTAAFLLARVYAWHGRSEKAIAVYNDLLAQYPNNADYLFGLAQVYVWTARYHEALPLLERARALSPSYEDVWRLELRALAGLGRDQRDRAIAFQKTAMARFPQSDWALPVEPEPAPEPQDWRFDARAGYQHLTNGAGDWQSYALDAKRDFGGDRSAYATLRLTRRFGLLDQSIFAGYAAPLTEGLAGVLEASYSPTAQVLPSWTAHGQLIVRLWDGWDVQGGLSRDNYPTTADNRVSLVLERYFGAWRASYTLGVTQLPGNYYPLSHQLALGYNFNARDFVVATAASGQEMDYVAAGRLLTSDVLALDLRGEYWLTSHWALTGDLGWVRQGDLYQRFGGQFGLAYGF